MQVLYIANTNQLDLLDVTSAADGTPVTGATGTYAIDDLAGNQIQGPLPLTEVAAGHYRGIVADTVSLSAGEYVMRTELLAVDGSVGRWSTPFTAEVRT